MLSLQEMSDRLEIQQLLVAYSTAIDQRRFDDLDRMFTADAYIDLIGLAVYRAADDQPITMALVHQVLDELSTHADGCDCGCAYVDRCDPAKVWRTAGYWQRQAVASTRRARR
jgi:hypothetical protein